MLHCEKYSEALCKLALVRYQEASYSSSVRKLAEDVVLFFDSFLTIWKPSTRHYGFRGFKHHPLGQAAPVMTILTLV